MLEAVDSGPERFAKIMFHVHESICLFTRCGAVPICLYSYNPVKDRLALWKPLVLGLLRSHNITLLVDSIWKGS